MLNVLINAYAVAPDMGSEPGMGWNWVINLARYCRVFVITEGEHKEKIERVLTQLSQKDNIQFFYNPVSERVRKMCWNQGDWRFYFHYHLWQKKTLKIARQICSENQIDIIHNLNMVGFREPGLLWKINGIPYVWGPFSGSHSIKISFLDSFGSKILYAIKNAINWLQIRHSFSVRHAIDRADLLMTPLREESELIYRLYGKRSIIIPETGLSDSYHTEKAHNTGENVFRLFWCGRFIETKKLDIALKTMALLTDLDDIELVIAGSGMNGEDELYKSMASSLGIEKKCVWLGNISNADVKSKMAESDLFFFTSIHEVTSTVVPEAIQSHLPILCHDINGFGAIVDDSIGRKIPLVSPKESVSQFAAIIRELYHNRSILKNMDDNFERIAAGLTYESKANWLSEAYENCISKHKYD